MGLPFPWRPHSCSPWSRANTGPAALGEIHRQLVFSASLPSLCEDSWGGAPRGMCLCVCVRVSPHLPSRPLSLPAHLRPCPQSELSVLVLGMGRRQRSEAKVRNSGCACLGAAQAEGAGAGGGEAS